MRTFKILATSLALVAVISVSTLSWFVVSNAALYTGNPPTSYQNDYGLTAIHTQSLFNTDGTVNSTVAQVLENFLSQSSNSIMSAEDFSNIAVSQEFGTPNAVGKATGALIIKLFPTVTGQGTATDLSNTWFQLVYQDGGILTLWAIEGYRSSHFNIPYYDSSDLYSFNTSNYTNVIDSYGGVTILEKQVEYWSGPDSYFVTEYDYKSNLHNGQFSYTGESDYANYSSSIVRHNILSDYSRLTSQIGGNIDQYFATAGDLPESWQSSEYQSGTTGGTGNLNGASAAGSTGTGRFDNAGTGGIYTSANGMDGVGGRNNWIRLQSCYQDKIWLPSSFETWYMGNDKEIGDPTYVDDYYAMYNNDNPIFSFDVVSQSPTLRHGLWRLNGYDRERSGLLRSTGSYSNHISTINSHGALCIGSENRDYGAPSFQESYSGNGGTGMEVRPAFHLNLSALGIDIGSGGGHDGDDDKECTCYTCIARKRGQ